MLKAELTERYLVPACGQDVDALRFALQALETVGIKFRSEAAIVVPALKHAGNTLLKRVIPEKQLKKLIKGESLRLGESNVVLSLVSQKTVNSTRAGVLLGAFASARMIQKIESSAPRKAIIILPWAGEEDTKEWKNSWSPVVLDLNDKS